MSDGHPATPPSGDLMPADASHDRHAPLRHSARAHAPRTIPIVTAAIAAIAGFVVVYAGTVSQQIEGAITTQDVDHIVDDIDIEVAETGALNILLMGSDVRDGENAEIGGDVTGGMRNDTTIIAHVAGDRSRVDMISIPRDMQVTIPDCALLDGETVTGGYGDFNIAFSNGGKNGNAAEAAACTINTIQQEAQVPIDHWAVVDFAGFIDMVDALGGVEMYIPTDIVSSKANLELEAGWQTLNGEEALGYARLRTAEVGDVSGSDLQRIERQQQLLDAMIHTIFTQNLLTDATALTKFLRAASESLTTDPELGQVEFVLSLAASLRNTPEDDFSFFTVPWVYTEDRLNVLPTEDAELMFEQLRADEPITLDAEGDASSDWDSSTDEPAPEPTTTTN
ncbi:LCP family protein [Demequina sp. B12]|uniref:LCP family protein n=1 Tax=Demequina sp. B12 TaxID=2992757 RepID=UPI00237AB2AF|nr:LCP family protein [Demequina sp. B12]MDE0573806.1 LCP family protein [Demequina sp. B12]